MSSQIKKIFICLILTSVIFFPVFAIAAPDDDNDDNDEVTTGHAPTIHLEEAITRVTNWTFVFVITIAVLFLLFAAFQFITAGGDPEKIAKARSSLFYGAIGVGVAVLAKGLVGFVRGLLGEK